jgi:hypothetical protein
LDAEAALGSITATAHRLRNPPGVLPPDISSPGTDLAHDLKHKAVEDSDQLAEVTERHFGYIPELIRMPCISSAGETKARA